MTSLTQLQNKKIAILGLGVEGLSSARYLTLHNLPFSILDSDPNLSVPVEVRVKAQAIFLGVDYLSHLNKFDVAIRTPGIRLSSQEIQDFKNSGKELTSQTKLFFDLCPAQIIGVTGTKGKGTTASLIYEILKKAGKLAFLGGNIGAPPLDFLDQVSSTDLVVLELSSFQLADLHKSPKIAIVLMITVDHLDYHLTEGAYWDAKSSIVRYQTPSDLAIINHDYPTSLSFSHKTKAKILLVSRKGRVTPGVYAQNGQIVAELQDGISTLMNSSEVGIVGEHNLENVCAAAAAAKSLGISSDVIHQAVREFKGLPHRLEFCDEVNGVKFYDDSASTNPETTIAALRSFNRPAVFILGGSSKQADFTKLGQEIALSPNVVGVLLIGEEASSIEQAIQVNSSFPGFILKDLPNMKEVVSKAHKLTPHGGVVVLSPACASFDMFKNYSVRGDKFKEEVKLLNEAT
jgi:UDP-N-acetylmuramoylalanine--D-glutamate ligase